MNFPGTALIFRLSSIFFYRRATPMQSALYTVLLPVLAVGGARLQSADITPLVAYLFILLAASTPLLMVFGIIHRRVWPILIYCLAVAIHWHTTVVTNHLWGWDIHYIYYITSLIKSSGYIPFGHPETHASLVAVTWFAAFLSDFIGVSIVSVFKYVFPLVSGLTALAIYLTARRIFETDLGAPLAAGVFIFFYRFFKVMPSKQAFGMMFISCLILVTVISRNEQPQRWSLIGSVFGVGLVLSHYSSASVYLIIFVGGIIFALIIGLLNRVDAVDLPQAVSGATPVLFVGLGWLWYYLNVSQGSVIIQVISIGLRSSTKVAQLLGIVPAPTDTAPRSRSGAGYVERLMSDPALTILGILTAIVLFFVVLGVVWMVFRLFKRGTEDPLYIGILLSGTGMFIAGIVVTLGLGFDRLIAFILVFLAPAVIGGAKLSQSILVHFTPISIPKTAAPIIVGVVLAAWFIMSSGLGFVVIPGSEVPAYAIGIDDNAGWPTYSDSEVTASRWIEGQQPENLAVHGRGGLIKERDGLLIAEVINRREISQVRPNWDQPSRECDIFYTSDRPMGELEPQGTTYYNKYLTGKNIIYTTGSATAYTCA